MAVTKNAPDYYINETALSFTPNYQGLRDVVYVSIVSNAAIAVYKDGIPELGYGSDASHQRWKLTGYTTKLGTTGAYYIYARLSRTEKKGMVIFSVNEYDVYGSVTSVDADGSESTTEPSTEYWYIRIGDITASTGDVDRQLNYDSGILGTNRGIAESNTLLEKMFKWNSTNGTFSMLAPLTNLWLSAKAVIQWGERTIKGIVGIPADYESSQTMAESEDELVTPKYVKAHGDLNYLSKKNDDTAEGNITFKKSIQVDEDVNIGGNVEVGGEQTVGGNSVIGGTQSVTGSQTIGGNQEVQGTTHLLDNLTVGDYFQQGDIIQGARVDKEGNAAFASITAPVMQIYELQYNRKTAVQEEFIFSDGDTIETVTYIQADGTEIDSATYNGEEYSYIRLGVRKQYEGYMTTFKDDDILYSNINIIGESGQPATAGKCWMKVLTEGNDLGVSPISSDGLFINAVPYTTEQCPAGVNIAPTPHMIISRHGNANGEKYPERQTVLIISTANENMVHLHGISSPIIDTTSAYAIVEGKLPATLLEKVQKHYSFLTENDPVSYARYGIFENILQFDQDGLPIQRENNRGVWQADTTYTNNASYYDVVTYDGQLWKCLTTHTSAADTPPSSSNTYWLLLVSKGSDAPSPNMLDDTNFDKVSNDIFDSWTKSDESGVAVSVVDKSESGIGQNAIAIEVQSLRMRCITQSVSGLSTDKWYTLSFYSKSHIDDKSTQVLPTFDTIDTSIYYNGELFEYDDGYEPEIATTNEWTAHAITFKPTTETITVGFGLYKPRMTRSALIAKVKLELASDQINPAQSVASDWRPSIADAIGTKGDKGDTGASIYLNGYWKEAETYLKENNCIPVVFYKGADEDKGHYYILTSDSSTGSIPADLVDWQVFQEFRQVFTEFLLAEQARFGTEDGGVFSNGWLFSSLKTDGSVWNGEEILEDGTFADGTSPLLAFNFKDGRTYAQNAVIRGLLYAKGGEFKDGDINIGGGVVKISSNGEGSIGGGRLRWSSTGETYKVADMSPIWTNISLYLKEKGVSLGYNSSSGVYDLKNIYGISDRDFFDLTYYSDEVTLSSDTVELPEPDTALYSPDGIPNYEFYASRLAYCFYSKGGFSSLKLRSFYDIKLYSRDGDQIETLSYPSLMRPKEGRFCRLQIAYRCYIGDLDDWEIVSE